MFLVKMRFRATEDDGFDDDPCDGDGGDDDDFCCSDASCKDEALNGKKIDKKVKLIERNGYTWKGLAI